jgi:CubicO group peptidase (beta-lactamase class C family)
MARAKVHDDASVSLREDVAKIASIPLQFEPGKRWLYSVATDVLAAVVEVIEGKPLQEVVAARITGPLGMGDTSFCPGADAADRIPPMLGGGKGGLLSPDQLAGNYPFDNPDFARGGHGLFSTLSDYAKFAMTLLSDARGGEAPVLLSAATLAHATANHAAPVMPLHIELPPQSINPGMAGQGFGLGFAVAQPGGPLTARPGAFGWSGAAETWFTVDPVSDIFMVQMTQNLDWPGASFDLQSMGYGALML